MVDEGIGEGVVCGVRNGGGGRGNGEWEKGKGF